MKMAGRVKQQRIVPRAGSSIYRGSVDRMQLEALATGAGKQSWEQRGKSSFFPFLQRNLRWLASSSLLFRPRTTITSVP